MIVGTEQSAGQTPSWPAKWYGSGSEKLNPKTTDQSPTSPIVGTVGSAPGAPTTNTATPADGRTQPTSAPANPADYFSGVPLGSDNKTNNPLTVSGIPGTLQQTSAQDLNRALYLGVDPSGMNPLVSSPSDVPSANDLQIQIDNLQRQLSQQRSRLNSLNQGSLGSGISRREFFATYESVMVQPLQANDSALLVEPANDQYTHIEFPWELAHSPRIQFGSLATGDQLGWRVRYWQFRHGISFRADATNGLVPAGRDAHVGYLSENGDITLGLEELTEGNFYSNIRTDVIDLEWQRQIADPLNIYFGIRYGKILQHYLADTDVGIARSRTQFRGVGPTLALQLDHPLPIDNFVFFANGRGSLLYGNRTMHVSDTSNNIAQSMGNSDLRNYDGANTLATNLELQVGVRCDLASWWNMSVAFETQHFGNVGGPNPIGLFTGTDFGLATGDPRDDSLGFAGVAVASNWVW
ncbi:MAG: Lpg1974 family pore-forming outer membrane protein [Planctomycetota bacterium]